MLRTFPPHLHRNPALKRFPFFFLPFLTACASTPSEPTQSPPTMSDTPAMQTFPPDLDNALLRARSQGTAELAFDIYRTLAQATPEANLFYSPYSIATALGMAYAGAENQTARDMEKALHFGDQALHTHEGFARLNQALEPRSLDDHPDAPPPFRLKMANDIWALTGYPYRETYLDTLGKYYGAELHTLDFRGEPEASRQTINQWVAKATEDKITDLLPPNSIHDDTRLILTNAVHFVAGWRFAFADGLTEKAPFHLLDGSTTEVDLMRLDHSDLPYVAADNFDMVELPYANGRVSMLLILPHEGQLESVEASLNASTLAELKQRRRATPGVVHLPRLDLKSELSLRQTLSTLGMASAFAPTRPGAPMPDFSGIADPAVSGDELGIDDVIHQATLKVDEEGTEAAAATAVLMVRTLSMPVDPPKPFEMRLDRPFILLIQDQPTGALLFVGRVLNP